MGAFALRQVVDAFGEQFVGDVALVNHETNEHVLVGQFLFEGMGVETIEHVVVLDGGMGANGLEATVVVGEDQSVGRDDHARAVAREVDDGLHDGVVGLVELFVGQFVALGLHLLVDGLWQVVEHPHALVGVSRRSRE